MKIDQIIKESSVGGTTAGAVATIESPMGGVQKRSSVVGLQPVEKLMKGEAKKKGPYQNSLVEGKMKDIDIARQDYQRMSPKQFNTAYKMTKQEWYEKNKQFLQKPTKAISEEELQEEDLILIPGQGIQRRTGFIKHDPDRAEHEGQTLKNSLHTIIRTATHLNKELSTRDNFPEWVSEKIGAIKGMMVSVMDYLISAKEMGMHDIDETGGVIAAGGVGEDIDEAFQRDESNLMYRYDPSDGKLKQRMVRNSEERSAYSMGYRNDPDKALKAAGIMRSKFDPNKYVMKKEGKWVQVFPFKNDITEAKDTSPNDKSTDDLERKISDVVKNLKWYERIEGGGNALSPGERKIRAELRKQLRQLKSEMHQKKLKDKNNITTENQLDEKFKSKQQAKLMYAVAGDKDVAKKTGVSQKVAKEFIKKSHGQQVSKLPKKVKKQK